MNINLNLQPHELKVEGEGFSFTLPLPNTEETENNVILENGDEFDSNSIENITYEPATQTLGVKFQTSDNMYRYVDVPLQKVFSFVRAYSLNEYWRNDIQPYYTSLDKVDFATYTKNW